MERGEAKRGWNKIPMVVQLQDAIICASTNYKSSLKCPVKPHNRFADGCTAFLNSVNTVTVVIEVTLTLSKLTRQSALPYRSIISNKQFSGVEHMPAPVLRSPLPDKRHHSLRVQQKEQHEQTIAAASVNDEFRLK
jgi:hypothetical protein